MKKVLSIILLIVLTVTSFAQGVGEEQTPIYPSTLAIPIEKLRNIKTFTVYNTATERKSFEVGVGEKDNFGETSEVSKYIKVFPKKFSLEPGASKEVRVSVENLPQEMLGKGEYKAALSIKGLSSKINEKYDTKTKSGSINTTLNIKININMAIYVLSGNEFEKIEIEKLSLNKKTKMYEIKIKNIGNYSYPIIINLLDKNKNILSKLESIKIFPGMVSNLSFSAIEGIDKIEIELSEKEKILNLYEVSELLSNQ